MHSSHPSSLTVIQFFEMVPSSKLARTVFWVQIKQSNKNILYRKASIKRISTSMALLLEIIVLLFTVQCLLNQFSCINTIYYQWSENKFSNIKFTIQNLHDYLTQNNTFWWIFHGTGVFEGG